MRVAGINHLNIKADAGVIARCRAFYIDVLGLVEGERPPFRSRGHWLYAGDQPIVHLSEAAHSETSGKSLLDHVALTCEGFDEFVRRLEANGIEHHIDRVPKRGHAQIFLRDPAGVAIELNFEHPSS